MQKSLANLTRHVANSGCHAYQGYFFSRPLPIADFEQLLVSYAQMT